MSDPPTGQPSTGARLTRRRLLAGGGLLAATAAVGGGGYAVGRAAARTGDDGAAGDGQAAVHRFVTRPDLGIPVVTTTVFGPTADGYLFLTPAAGVGGRGPLLVDDTGTPVWFRQVSGPDVVAVDARVQRYAGRPVLTWWEGNIDRSNGVGAGEFVIVDESYREVRRLRTPEGDRPGSGVPADQHDFVLTDDGTALFFVYEPVAADLSAVGGPADGALYDNVIYEVDVASGRTVWTWRASDHIDLAESYAPAPSGARTQMPYDFFHANSVGLDDDGDLLVSARHTWAIYNIARRDGTLRWRLGGKRSDFTSGEGAAFSWQHDARRRSDGTLGLFDNAAGITTDNESAGAGTTGGRQSRGVILALDEARRTATLVRELRYPEPVLSPTQGGMQELPGGASLVGWGERPFLAEFSPAGELRLTGRLPADNGSYRAYRFPWTGRPDDRPAIATRPAEGAVTVYASWNGATEVRRWRVRAGQRPDELRPVADVDRRGFEASVRVPRPVVFVAADALDAGGRVLASSRVLPVPPPDTGQ